MFRTKVTLDSGVGGFQLDLGDYSLDYIERDAKLVVTFDSAGETCARPKPLRHRWGQTYLLAHGYSVLGIKLPKLD